MNRRASRTSEQLDIDVAHALEAALEGMHGSGRTSRAGAMVGPWLLALAQQRRS